jgi:hypothetical protein
MSRTLEIPSIPENSETVYLVQNSCTPAISLFYIQSPKLVDKRKRPILSEGSNACRGGEAWVRNFPVFPDEN